METYFSLRSRESETGERVTRKIASESATDMVTRELRILNLPQVMDPNESLEQGAAPPPRAGGAPAFETPGPAAAPRRPSEAQSTGRQGATAPPRQQPGSGALPPAPRYRPADGPRSGRPTAASTQDAPSPPAPPPQPDAESSSSTPRSRYVRADGDVLYMQTPEGEEQRVTQYMRTHFLRMIEKDIPQADDADIELWWKAQGSLDAGTTMQEAQSQNLLAEALKAAGKLKLRELELLEQVVQSWLTARRNERAEG